LPPRSLFTEIRLRFTEASKGLSITISTGLEVLVLMVMFRVSNPVASAGSHIIFIETLDRYVESPTLIACWYTIIECVNTRNRSRANAPSERLFIPFPSAF